MNGEGTRPMRIEINGTNIGLYQVPATPSHTVAGAQVYNIGVNTSAGNLSVKIYTNTDEGIAPDVYDIRLTQTQYSSLVEAETGVLSGGASINGDFVNGVGGVSGGALTITRTVPFTGVYDLIVSYVSSSNNAKIRAYINGVDTGYRYSFLKTNSLNMVDSKTKVIRVNLSQGTNTIMFK